MYKFPLLFVIIAIAISHNKLTAQENSNESGNFKFIGIEASSIMQFPGSPKFDFIRGDVLPYSSGGVSETLNALAFKKQVGIKLEFRNKTNRWGLLFGLHYSRMNTTLGKESVYSSNSKYFYLLDNHTGTTTEYFRVREINRNIDFVGIPIEIRWLSNTPRMVKLYFKLGAEFDFKINSVSEVVFQNQDMSEYQDIVLNKFEKPGAFFSSVYFATGLNLNKKPNIDLEMIFPYIVLTPKTSGILEPHSGIGLKLEIRLPF